MKAMIEICQSKQLKYKRVKCKVCYGTGRDTAESPTGMLCGKCGGKGWRMFPKGTTESCPLCSGRGKDFRLNRLGTVCPDCDGFGEVKVL